MKWAKTSWACISKNFVVHKLKGNKQDWIEKKFKNPNWIQIDWNNQLEMAKKMIQELITVFNAAQIQSI